MLQTQLNEESCELLCTLPPYALASSRLSFLVFFSHRQPSDCSLLIVLEFFRSWVPLSSFLKCFDIDLWAWMLAFWEWLRHFRPRLLSLSNFLGHLRLQLRSNHLKCQSSDFKASLSSVSYALESQNEMQPDSLGFHDYYFPLLLFNRHHSSLNLLKEYSKQY